MFLDRSNFIAKALSVIISIDPQEIKRFNDAYIKDEYFSRILKDLTEPHDTKNPPYSQYKIGDNGLIYFNRDDNYKLCVPKDLQLEIMSEVHNNLAESTHAGHHRTYNHILLLAL